LVVDLGLHVANRIDHDHALAGWIVERDLGGLSRLRAIEEVPGEPVTEDRQTPGHRRGAAVDEDLALDPHLDRLPTMGQRPREHERHEGTDDTGSVAMEGAWHAGENHSSRPDADPRPKSPCFPSGRSECMIVAGWTTVLRSPDRCVP
jgi:hypothetical protein